ncbi:HAD-IA family hydrolase [Bacteroides sp.]|uniref:HAD-IA family hydrolase n=1 Tax=Bacteroides sp. TaxID=29523 RepID=UPI00263799D1|nr:HAD-IA family hydrolase [Bacteroides sp.]
MSYTTYLFDFDYTLADSSRGIVTCFRNVLTRHGYMDVTDDQIKRTIGKTLQESFSILTGVTDPEQLEGFRKEYSKEADTHMTVNTVLFLETKSVLIALKDAGARIGIISTKYRYRIKELLDQHFPTNFMDIIVGGEDVKNAKPSPEGLLLAIKQLHTTKAETLYIGDSTVDAETAQNAGVDFAGVTHGVTTAQELSKYPHWKIMSTLDELLDGSDKQLSIPNSEKILLPENDSPAPRKRKMINVWQILLLMFILWLTYEEMGTSETWVFAIFFILTLWGIMQKRRILPKKVTAFFEPWWRPCRIRLRAFHIKLIRGRETPTIDDTPSTCQNCGTSYTGNFCNRCGQTRNTPRYHLSNAFKNIMGGFTNIDNGFGRTLLELLYRPGYMIRDFIGGQRVHYFRPFQTLFVLAALYIMCVQLVDPEALNPKKNKKQDNTEYISDAKDKLQKGMDNAQTAEEKRVYAITIQTLEKQFESTTAKTDSTVTTPVVYEDSDNDLIDDLLESSTEVTGKLEQYLQHSPFLLKVWNLMKSWGHGNKAFRIISTLPLFALATMLAFRRKKHKLTYNLTEHVFIQAFIACQILLISIIVLPFNGTARVNDLYEVSVWLIFFLFCWDYKQLYHCTWWRSFWKTLLMFFYSLILLAVFAALVVSIAVAGFYLLRPFL